MNDARDKAVRLLKLPNDAYFSLDDERLVEMGRALSEIYGEAPAEPADAQPDIAIGAPLSAASRDELPLLVARHYTGTRDWQVDPAQNLLVLAVNLATGEVRSGLAMATGKRQKARPPSGSGEPPSGPLATQVGNVVHRFNAAALFPGGLPTGRYALAAVNYDLLSNVVVVNWRPKETRAAPAWKPAVVAVTKENAATRAGLLLDLPARVAGGAAVSLRASVFLPESQVTRLKLDGKPDQSLLPATVFLMRLDQPAAFRLDVGVPVKKPASSGKGVNTLFAIDLRQAGGARLAPGTYRAFLVVGAAITGPAPVTLE
jgi:hypothetical protein